MPRNDTKLNQLLQQYCPDGVEFRKLGGEKGICKIETGKLNANAAIEDGEFMFFTTAKEVSKIDTYRWDTEALLIAGNANVGDVKHYIGKFEAYQRTYVLTDFSNEVNVRFLYFVITNNLKDYLKKNKNESAMTYIVLSTLQNFQIPIPPLPIQEEIVKILDKFTSLEAELEAELEARKSQYEYYRDKLLAFGEGKVEWKSLGEVVSLKRGVRVTKNQLEENGLFPVYQNSLTPLGFFHQFNYQKNKTFVISAGAAGSIGYSNTDFRAADDCLVMECPELINNRYLYYFLKTKESFLASKVRRASIPRLGREFIEKIKIPIPPLEQQQAIVYVLDNFDKLANDLTEGLPAELKLRQQQHEYYRDLLLDFTDKNGDLRERERVIKIIDKTLRRLATEESKKYAEVFQKMLEKVEWKSLGEVFEMRNGYTPSKSNPKYWENGTVPWFRMEDIRENGYILDKSLQSVNLEGVKGKKLFPANSIIVATSATIGEHALIKVKHIANQRFVSLSLLSEYKNMLDMKFIFYYFYKLDQWCLKNITKSSFASVDMSAFKNFKIPIPSPEKQQEIIAILDKFDTLVHDLSTGLPAELEARRKQYEYYRNQLLTFTPLKE